MSTLPFVSDTFDAARWRDVDLPGDPLTDMTFHRLVSRGESDHAPAGEDLPVVRIAFDRPAIRNAFRPHTVDELYRCIDAARCTPDVACLLPCLHLIHVPSHTCNDLRAWVSNSD